MTTEPERWANRMPPADDGKRAGNVPPQDIDEVIEQMDRTPDSGIATCHAQGKTAIYVNHSTTRTPSPKDSETRTTPHSRHRHDTSSTRPSRTASPTGDRFYVQMSV